jgi:hypothetical protein
MNTQVFDKRDDFNFSIVNFPHLCCNIPFSPAYGVYISQLIRYAKACLTYDHFFFTDKQVDITVFHSLLYRQLSIIFTVAIQRSSLPIQPSLRPNAVWCISYQSLSRSWHTNINFGSYLLPYLELGLKAGVRYSCHFIVISNFKRFNPVEQQMFAFLFYCQYA